MFLAFWVFGHFSDLRVLQLKEKCDIIYAKNGKHTSFWMGFISLLAPFVHGFIVVAAVKAFFPNDVYSYFNSKYCRLADKKDFCRKMKSKKCLMSF